LLRPPPAEISQPSNPFRRPPSLSLNRGARSAAREEVTGTASHRGRPDREGLRQRTDDDHPPSSLCLPVSARHARPLSQMDMTAIGRDSTGAPNQPHLGAGRSVNYSRRLPLQPSSSASSLNTWTFPTVPGDGVPFVPTIPAAFRARRWTLGGSSSTTAAPVEQLARLQAALQSSAIASSSQELAQDVRPFLHDCICTT
jgi:hypothetical protein